MTEAPSSADSVTPPTAIHSVSDLLRLLGPRTGDIRWFRGQTDAGWGLVPGVGRRRSWLEAEELMIKRFKQDAYPRLREKPTSEWEWIFLAQHYGVPTRLLDWSENPLVALFFAVEQDSGSEGEPVDGKFFSSAPTELNEQTFPGAPSVLLFGHDDQLDRYLPAAVANTPKLGPIAAVAARSFDRLVAQSGTFTVAHQDLRSLDEIVEGGTVQNWVVPVTKKEFIRDELSSLNITASTVYPDLAHLGTHVRDLYY